MSSSNSVIFDEGRNAEPLLATQNYIGSSIPRLDSMIKSTGKAKYTKDLRSPGMLYAKVKRCPYPHAKIVRIDTSRLCDIAGIRAVITGRDFPMIMGEDSPPLAAEEVLHAGQGVLAVAADTLQLAERAIDAVEVDYEELDAVLDPEQAIGQETSSPKVVINHPGEEGAPNIGRHIRVKRGDAEHYFSTANEGYFVVENTYTTSAETHFQMEPMSFMVQPDLDGGLTVWGTSAGAHKLKIEVARYLGTDPHLVRAKVPFLGGWFGSKNENHVAAICAMLALKSGKTVKLELSREENITSTGVRHPTKITVKDSVDRNNGRILARKIRAIYDGGAYGAHGNQTLSNAVLTSICVYDIPNLSIDVFRVYTNHVPGVSKRSPMVVQMAWAVECQMDVIASKLGLNPVEFRQRHLLRKGELNAIGERMEGICYDRCLLEAAKSIGFGKGVAGGVSNKGVWRKGKGIAVTGKYATTGVFQASISVKETGKVEVIADLVENGQGILTGITQLVATEFGIPTSEVMISSFGTADSQSTGVSRGASGSTQLVDVGKALQIACNEAKRKITKRASVVLGVDQKDLIVQGGKVISKNPDKSLNISDLYSKTKMFGHLNDFYFDQFEDFTGSGTVLLKTGRFDPITGQAIGGRMSAYYIGASQGVDLSVNIETGEVRLDRIVAVADVGKAINPELIRGQLLGSVSMGASAALFEELIISNGVVNNANLADYKIQSALDAIGTVDTIMLEERYEDGPFGAKSVGEASIVPTAPAIRNAIHDAVGVWINDLPMTRERVLLALERKQQNQAEDADLE